jgi:hypothetical protein
MFVWWWCRKHGGGGGFGGLCLLSAELQAFTGQEKMSRPQIVKSIWTYIKANELQVGPAAARYKGLLLSDDRKWWGMHDQLLAACYKNKNLNPVNPPHSNISHNGPQYLDRLGSSWSGFCCGDAQP